LRGSIPTTGGGVCALPVAVAEWSWISLTSRGMS